MHSSFFPPLRRSLSVSAVQLSGHNKWSKIKAKKGLEDAKRSQVFSKASRDIMVAARTGGSIDPEKNTALAATLRTAKAFGVPKDNIERALAKASGGKDKGSQLMTYEALAHGVVGVIIECLTDNSVRTVSKIRDILKSHSAQFTSVAFQFQRKGYVKVALDKGDDFSDRLEQLIATALESTAEDFGEVQPSGNSAEIEFTCPPNTLARLTSALVAPGLSLELLSSELIWRPLQRSQLDETIEAKIAYLVDALEEEEDTLRVWTTLDT